VTWNVYVPEPTLYTSAAGVAAGAGAVVARQPGMLCSIQLSMVVMSHTGRSVAARIAVA